MCSWPSLGNRSVRRPTSCIHAVVIKKDGDELFDHYRHTLEALGNQKRLLGLIFTKSQNKFQDPAKLRRLMLGFQLAALKRFQSADVCY